MAAEHSQSRGRMTKELWIAAALGAGSTAERAAREWAELEEFRELVESSAEGLGIEPGTPRFGTFSSAMLEAKWLGEQEAVESLVWSGRLGTAGFAEGVQGWLAAERRRRGWFRGPSRVYNGLRRGFKRVFRRPFLSDQTKCQE
jgi:hypothetical protein